MPLEDLVRRWSPAGARVVPAPWTSPRPEGWTRFVCFSDPGRNRRRMAPYGATGFTRRELWKMEDTSKIFQVIYVIWPFLMGTLNEHDQPVEFRVFFAKESDKPSCTWVWYLIFFRGKPSTSAGWEHSLPYSSGRLGEYTQFSDTSIWEMKWLNHQSTKKTSEGMWSNELIFPS